MERFGGKVAFVTGGGSGIGRACCLRFAEEGAKVAVVDLIEERAAATAQRITASGGTAMAVGADVSKPDQVQEAVGQVSGQYGRLDILVNSVAWVARKRFVDTSLDEWYKCIDVCLNTYFLCIKFCLPEMIKAGGGRIVSIASVSGQVGLGLTAYSAAKGGVLAMTRELAAEFAPYHVNINSVSPGVTQTGINVDILSDPEIRGQFIEVTPRGRLGQPEDIAAGVLFLASPDADFITGTDLKVDGGMSSTLTLGSASSKYRSFHGE